ncbi:hypothetical protein [Streptomyces sp. NPDC057623]|uniref:hypothetical protein n=1 Tax=Streptomyces sp. NPDC057623 TaxID=3346187 RepID=UPI0036BC2A98
MPVTAKKLAERTERFGLRLSHAHAVAVAQGPTASAEGDPTPGRWNGRPSPASATSTSYSQDGRVLCIASGRQDDVLAYLAKQAHAATDDDRAAIGRTQPGPGGVVQSYEAALNALQPAERLGLGDPVLRAADLLVHPVLTRDRRARADLILDTLTPYSDLSSTPPQVRTLLITPEPPGEHLESVLGATPHEFESRILR